MCASVLSEVDHLLKQTQQKAFSGLAKFEAEAATNHVTSTRVCLAARHVTCESLFRPCFNHADVGV